jgi:DNA processing protein
MDELGYWVALSRVTGVGPGRLRLLKAHFGSLECAWRASSGELRAAGLEERVIEHIGNAKATLSPEAELSLLRQHEVEALTLDDPRYPALLAEAPDCPPVLYIRGVLPPLDELLLAIVGTRRPTAYGKQATAEIVEQLVSRHVVTVSGLAWGIDTIVHRETLERGGTTLAVLAAGLDAVYPSENLALARRILEGGALLSEHPPGVKLRRENFLRRNRIMSGMSRGTVVVEAGAQSGALATARNALDQNREVFAIPGSIFSPASKGTNALIQRGEAKLVSCAADILTEFGIENSVASAGSRLVLQADATQVRLLAEMGAEPVHSDDLARRLHLSSQEVSAALTLLELQGVVQDLGNMQYAVSGRWESEAK